MSTEKCENKNPLRLKGIAQEKRFPKALDPNSVKIDGKTPADYQRIAREFSKLIQFYNTSNQRDGDWELFFNEIAFASLPPSPHVALFNAFINLLKHAQEDLNQITAKHLEFYYKDALQIAFKAPIPDEVHLLFGLTNNVKSHLIKEGTLVRAGKDLNGNQLLYKTKEDLIVNRIEVAELKSVFVETNELNKHKTVYAAKIANSADGNGEEIDSENPKWAPFGKRQAALVTKTMDFARMGMAIASDFLLFKEGNRTITLTVNYTGLAAAPSLSKEEFTVYLSGEKAWIEVQPVAVSTSINQLTFVIELTPEIEAVVPYQETVFLENFNTELPILKLVINQNEANNLYGKLADIQLTSIDLSAQVSDIQEIVLQNEFGIVDPTKPFELFGSRPVIGSEFYIGNQEAFSKKLTELTLAIDWLNKPIFSNHYAQYQGGKTYSDYKVAIHYLNNRKWKEMNADQNLFGSEASNKIDVPSVSLFYTQPDPVNDFTELTHQQKNGFIKLELVAPDKVDFKAFGHGEYQNLYVETATSIAKGDGGTLPKEPYTPKIKSLKIGYSANVTIPLASAGQHFYHLGAFGLAERTGAIGTGISFLPSYANEGNFYIGLKNAELPQNLNLLFQVSDGSSDPNKLPVPIRWSFLVDNEWVDFDTELISDSTNGLINSGIMVIQLPKKLNNDNTWLTPKLYWIKASIATDSDSVCQLINVHTQAVTAVFEDHDNELSHLETALPAGTISKLSESQSVIKVVDQPYASFNARVLERGNDYFLRASERLRHKNRPITIWDYERLVLEEFPSVYKLKCLNHTRMNAYYSEQAPGHVSLIIVSNLRNKNAVNPLQPTTSIATLTAIKDFLTKIKDPFVELHIKNPDFEEVKTEFNVRFHDGFDQSFYETQLKSDLKQYLSPWAYAEGVDISFEGVIHKSKIINFVEELPYVDYVTCFKMYHIIGGDLTIIEDVNEIEPTKSSALIVSATDHTINVLTTDDCECEVDNIQTVVVSGGIGVMTINADFTVNKV